MTRPTPMQVRPTRLQARRAVATGRVTLRQLAGLTDQEMCAMAAAADELLRQRRAKEAGTIYGMLCSVDPLESRWWSRLAQLQAQCGEPTAAAVCEQVAGLVRCDRRARREGGLRCE